MEFLDQWQAFAVMVIPVLLAITVHEAAHGWVAYLLGDPTAYERGRVTLNPIRHLDPIGTIIFPIMTFFFVNVLFGWAKPVPINWSKLKHPRRDMALIALAGPLANLCMAAIWGLISKIGLILISQWIGIMLLVMGGAGVLSNIVLFTLNLFPILPLDGGRVLHSILPSHLAYWFSRLEPFGLLILLILLATGSLNLISSPLIEDIINLLPGAEIVKLIFLAPKGAQGF